MLAVIIPQMFIHFFFLTNDSQNLQKLFDGTEILKDILKLNQVNILEKISANNVKAGCPFSFPATFSKIFLLQVSSGWVSRMSRNKSGEKTRKSFVAFLLDQGG